MRHNGISVAEVANAPFHDTPINAAEVSRKYKEWEERRGLGNQHGSYKERAKRYAELNARRKARK